jgi:tRNA threonylcarbamoyladenosine biosynthesis protein TsaB
MILLAVETATDACSAALVIGDETIERFKIAPRAHTQLILPMIDELFAEAEIGINQVDAMAFGRGPGAFTGVRIAAGVTQGIAFAVDLPVTPVSTLAALAQGCDADRVLVAVDARMNEVYWGAYQRNPEGLMTVRGGECVVPPGEAPLPEQPQSSGAQWYGAGSGWSIYATALKERCGGLASVRDGERLPHARDVAHLGMAAFQAGQAVSAEQALPVYLRDQVAWRKSR